MYPCLFVCMLTKTVALTSGWAGLHGSALLLVACPGYGANAGGCIAITVMLTSTGWQPINNRTCCVDHETVDLQTLV